MISQHVPSRPILLHRRNTYCTSSGEIVSKYTNRNTSGVCKLEHAIRAARVPSNKLYLQKKPTAFYSLQRKWGLMTEKTIKDCFLSDTPSADRLRHLVASIIQFYEKSESGCEKQFAQCILDNARSSINDSDKIDQIQKSCTKNSFKETSWKAKEIVPNVSRAAQRVDISELKLTISGIDFLEPQEPEKKGDISLKKKHSNSEFESSSLRSWNQLETSATINTDSNIADMKKRHDLHFADEENCRRALPSYVDSLVTLALGGTTFEEGSRIKCGMNAVQLLWSVAEVSQRTRLLIVTDCCALETIDSICSALSSECSRLSAFVTDWQEELHAVRVSESLPICDKNYSWLKKQVGEVMWRGLLYHEILTIQESISHQVAE